MVRASPASDSGPRRAPAACDPGYKTCVMETAWFDLATSRLGRPGSAAGVTHAAPLAALFSSC
jgi:hypothetical protein